MRIVVCVDRTAPAGTSWFAVVFCHESGQRALGVGLYPIKIMHELMQHSGFQLKLCFCRKHTGGWVQNTRSGASMVAPQHGCGQSGMYSRARIQLGLHTNRSLVICFWFLLSGVEGKVN